jgi:prevent-host-death family protein
MALNVSLDRMVSVTEARARLREIIEQTNDDQFWVLTSRGKPRVALVDIDYLDQLVRRAWFDSLASRSQDAFDNWLRRRGLDPETVTEQEIESFLQA